MRKDISDIIETLINTMPRNLFSVKKSALLRDVSELVLKHIETQYRDLSDDAFNVKVNCTVFLLQSMLISLDHIERDHNGFLKVLIDTVDLIVDAKDVSKMIEKSWLSGGLHSKN